MTNPEITNLGCGRYTVPVSRHYVTTAIDFPNAAPHMGHVMEKILADVVVRWMRLRGDQVRFHIGTDENGIKIQQTAKTQGLTPKELVDRNAPLFEDLFRQLGISYDYFIRTSDPVSHWPTVAVLWKKLQAAGVLEKQTYTGLYCEGCERFVTVKDLVDGKCPDHNQVPKEVTEENWFFLLSKKQKDLQKLLNPKNKKGYAVVPDWRANETVMFLNQGLEDVSFSRSTQTLTWGVPVPDDPDQVMYVWCDNLTSYISSLGALTDHDELFQEWWNGATVTHVIGKDIARFHALNWPAMLQEAGLKTPDRLLIHGFLTSEGQKMSKTLGNVVVPQEVIDKYGIDPLRFYLSHEIPVGNDGDFSWKRFGELYDSALRNSIGNLLNRVLVLFKKEGGRLGDVGEPTFITGRQADYRDAMDRFELSKALQIAVSIATDSNKYIDMMKPWELKGDEKRKVLSQLAEAVRHLSLALLPFVPDTARRIARQLNVPYADRMLDRNFVITPAMREWASQKDWTRVGEAEILFPPLEG